MKCSQVLELLSMHYDDELAENVKTDVAAHIENCPDCTSELAGFERLSNLASGVAEPLPKEHMWGEIENRLDDDRNVEPAVGKTPHKFATTRIAILAASLILALGGGWFVYHSWFGHGNHSEFTAEFAHYLEEFKQNPAAAQEILLANYPHERVDPRQPIKTLGYRPAVAQGLPAEYSLVSTHVMNMPCCKCIQTLCKRSDGTTLAIFEHDDEEGAEWFGDMPAIVAKCSERQCSLVELDDHIAASWKRGKRHITLIGVRDIEEIAQLVTHLGEGEVSVAN